MGFIRLIFANVLLKIYVRKLSKIINKAKASLRIAVEHVNARIKTFKILGEKYRNRRKRFGLRFNLICALVNFDRGFRIV